MIEAFSDPPVVVRFAPSPTGSLHVGSARTALFNALYHRRHGGRLIFRIEDTDRAREVVGAVDKMLSDLKWLGIDFSEGEGIGGSFAPYKQSERTPFYANAIATLIAKGVGYRCFCTPERIVLMHQESSRTGKPPRYDRRCRSLPQSEIEAQLDRSTPFVVRLAIDPSRTITINDLVKGSVAFAGEHLDDPILLRTDGSPTGLLAGAVDDYMMQVTHIFRADEWLPSTPYQYGIFQGLGGPLPQWGHLSLLVDESHAKLSKRTAGLSVAELRENGVLPEAFCRYLAGLGRGTIPSEQGWDLGGLARDFDPAKYRSGEVIYSWSALLAENQKFLRKLSQQELLLRFVDWCKDENPFGTLIVEKYYDALQLASEGASTLSDCHLNLKSLIDPPNEREVSIEQPTGRAVVETIIPFISECEWTIAGIEDAIGVTGQTLALKGRDLYAPLRRALTGREHGPKIAAVMKLLGRDECLTRFQKYFTFFSTPNSTV